MSGYPTNQDLGTWRVRAKASMVSDVFMGSR